MDNSQNEQPADSCQPENDLPREGNLVNQHLQNPEQAPVLLNTQPANSIHQVPTRQKHRLSSRGDLQPSRTMFYWSIGLFILTFISTTFVGSDLYHWVFIIDQKVKAEILSKSGYWNLFASGLYYSLPVMSILLAHELGHYLQCMRYGIPATPPLFIPLPIYPLGTMGAVILQSPNIPHRKVLFDIAVSGPLAGLVVAIPLMFYALSYAKYDYVAPGTEVFGDPLLFRMVAEWYHGPVPTSHEIMVDGIGVAVWVGLLVTGLNLIPIGQLDGGHILYALIRKKSHDLALFLMIFIGAYMVLTFNFQYILMFALLLRIGIYHPPTRNDRLPLGVFRTILGWGTLLFLFIGFTPQPVLIKEGPIFNEPGDKKILIQDHQSRPLITHLLSNEIQLFTRLSANNNSTARSCESNS